MKLYGIYGSGGFGREVIPIANMMLSNLFSKTQYKIVFIAEEKPSIATLNNYPVLTVAEFFEYPANERFFNIAIANYEARKRIAETMGKHGAQPFTIKAPNCVMLDENDLADGAIFCPFTTVTSNAKIGKFFHANIYSYIAHDCVIGDYVTFAPCVQCNGNVIIEDDAYVGTGAIIKQGTPAKPMVIGRGAIIGMGAVVTKSVPPYTTVIGNPAQPLVRKETISN